MQIELHNDTYFHPKPSTMQAKSSNKTYMHIEDLAFQPHDPKLHTVNDLHNHTGTTPHVINITRIIDMPSKPNAPTLYQLISNSTYKLYIARQWYLVQANIEYSMHFNDN